MPSPLSPAGFPSLAAALHGTGVAVVCGGRAYTWQEFEYRCRKLAGALTSAGLQPGDRVAYLSYNCHQLLEAYFAVPMIGAVLAPLNVRLAPREIRAILNHSEVYALFYDTLFEAAVRELSSDCPALKFTAALGDECERMLDAAKPAAASTWQHIDEHAAAALFYTSGSAADPKGVLLSHRALYLHAVDVASLYSAAQARVDLHAVPMFHANAWGHAHASVLLGIPQVMVPKFEADAMLHLIEQHRATEVNVVPTMAHALIKAGPRAVRDLRSVRHVQVGGAAAPARLMSGLRQLFPEARVFEGYGLTEAGSAVATSLPGSANPTGADGLWPISGVEVRVVDGVMQDVQKDGSSTGEIVVRTDHMMIGYDRDPVATAETLAGGWLHTGDLGVWREDGSFQIVDRIKEIIISGAENISCAEVERAISEHPDVAECAVVGAAHSKWGEVPAAVVVLKPGSVLTEANLFEFLNGRLGRYKMPRILQFTSESLPRSGSGKIRKQEIRARFV
ncbi:MAG TPA: AMP-binding protein [Bryobacteraceae bacterium]|nr:AMP-binding protein [Bryobacteraceae bacterium]